MLENIKRLVKDTENVELHYHKRLDAAQELRDKGPMYIGYLLQLLEPKPIYCETVETCFFERVMGAVEENGFSLDNGKVIVDMSGNSVPTVHYWSRSALEVPFNKGLTFKVTSNPFKIEEVTTNGPSS